MYVECQFKPTVYIQKDNFCQDKAMHVNIERGFIRDGLVEYYNTEMKKALEAKSVVKLSEQVIKSWTGPIHYLCHFPVLKTGSLTNKV